MTIVAIFLSRIMDTDDLTNIFIALGLGLPAIIVLTLAQWTTNTNNLYSASLGFSVVFQKGSEKANYYCGRYLCYVACRIWHL